MNANLLLSFYNCSKQRNGDYYWTKSPPLQLFPKLWISTECEQAIPYFDENEIGELAEIHGLYDHEKKSQWARAIYFSTLGHPQLVHARVRTLSDSGWSATIQDIAKPEDVERIRADARSRLIEEFPSDTARMLAYRLSIVSGAFRRNTVFAVAGSPPPVNLLVKSLISLLAHGLKRRDRSVQDLSVVDGSR